MPALNFKCDFVGAIQRGEKKQTIRQIRKRPIKPGDILHLYTGMRTARCKKIGVAICESVQSIEIHNDRMSLDDADMLKWEQVQMALADGFRDVDGFRAFFERHYGLPFSGVVIRFRLTPVVGDAAINSHGGKQAIPAARLNPGR
ncbi:MAG: hypothetical protein WC359_15140 [Dehalococcoidia bacterium]|jgi:hypothetical protein